MTTQQDQVAAIRARLDAALELPWSDYVRKKLEPHLDQAWEDMRTLRDMLDEHSCSSCGRMDTVRSDEGECLPNCVEAVAVRELLAELGQGCPCLYVEPCSYACSCASPGVSGGCERCCRYGSLEQRQAQAERLAERDRKHAEDVAAMAMPVKDVAELVGNWPEGEDFDKFMAATQ